MALVKVQDSESVISNFEFLPPSISRALEADDGEWSSTNVFFILREFSGPKNSRKITKKSFVEFYSQQSAIKALEALGGKNKKFEITDSESCTLTTAITAINQKRNWSLRKASELIKESSLSSGKNVEINWKERRVTVDSKEVFLQSNQDLGGRFLNPYDRLKLP